MAEEFVRKEHFEEFVKRMEAGLAHVNELADQRYDSMNQRFDSLEKRFDDLRRIILLMLGTIVAAAIGAMVKVSFFS